MSLVAWYNAHFIILEISVVSPLTEHKTSLSCRHFARFFVITITISEKNIYFKGFKFVRVFISILTTYYRFSPGKPWFRVMFLCREIYIIHSCRGGIRVGPRIRHLQKHCPGPCPSPGILKKLGPAPVKLGPARVGARINRHSHGTLRETIRITATKQIFTAFYAVTRLVTAYK